MIAEIDTFKHIGDDRFATVQLLPKQFEFVHDDTHAEILYSGAFGAGKSRALCYRAMKLAINPRARVGLFRKRMTDLRKTTLKTLLEPDGDLPAVLATGTYHYHKTPGDERVVLRDGGQILLAGCDDEKSIGSMQLSDALIDECVELDEAEWTMVSGRCRVAYTNTDGTMHLPSMCGATNPGGPDHFLFKKFIKNPVPGYHRVINTAAYDNYFLDKSYFIKLGHMTGVTRARFLFGQWAAAEGLVYTMFDPNIHTIHNPGPFVRFVAGVDEGFTNPMVLRIHGVDGDGRSHVVASFYQSGLTSDEFLQWCSLAQHEWNPLTFVVDPSAAELIERMNRMNFETYPAENDLTYGISVMRNRLTVCDDGRPRLTMEPGLDGNHEYLTYVLDPNADKRGVERPVKMNDHVPDADRYASVAIERGYGRMSSFMPLVEREREKYDDGSNGLPINRDDDMQNPELWRL